MNAYPSIAGTVEGSIHISITFSQSSMRFQPSYFSHQYISTTIFQFFTSLHSGEFHSDLK
jgi:hypothetical protein